MKIPILLGSLLRMRPHTNHTPPSAGFFIAAVTPSAEDLSRLREAADLLIQNSFDDAV